jgi:hypothetical protein
VGSALQHTPARPLSRSLPARAGNGRAEQGGALEHRAACAEILLFHVLGKNPCYSSLPRRRTAVQAVMKEKILRTARKNVIHCKAPLKSGVVEESELHLAGLMKRSKKFDCNDAQNCARIQGFADRSESEEKKKF